MSPSVVQKPNKTQKSERPKLFIYKWVAGNIFRFKLWDSGFYLVLYILIPVFATIISLSTLGTELHNAAYCYFSIMVSAVSCFHDALGRWEDRSKSYKNIKLKVIVASCIAAFSYGLFQFLAISIGGTLSFRKDHFLLSYIPAIIVALMDFFAVISRENSLSDAVYR